MKTFLSSLLLVAFLFNCKAQRFTSPQHTTLTHAYAFNFQKTKQQYFAGNLSVKEGLMAKKDMDSDDRLRKAKRQRNAGIVLMSLGTVFLAGAITTGILGTKDTYDTSKPSLILRGSALGSGVLSGVFFGIGLPLTIVGAHRQHKYGN